MMTKHSVTLEILHMLHKYVQHYSEEWSADDNNWEYFNTPSAQLCYFLYEIIEKRKERKEQNEFTCGKTGIS